MLEDFKTIMEYMYNIMRSSDIFVPSSMRMKLIHDVDTSNMESLANDDKYFESIMRHGDKFYFVIDNSNIIMFDGEYNEICNCRLWQMGKNCRSL